MNENVARGWSSPKPDSACYRAIFLEIGAPWLWDRAAEMSDAEVAAHCVVPNGSGTQGNDAEGGELKEHAFEDKESGIGAMDGPRRSG